jgi:hypothetical protein
MTGAQSEPLRPGGEAHDDAGQYSAQAGKQYAHDKRKDGLAVGL